MLAYAKVVAPFDGVITRKAGGRRRPRDARQAADRNGKSRRRCGLSPMCPTRSATTSRLGEQLNVKVGIRFGRRSTARVSEIAPAADPVNRTLQVKLDLPATPGLRSGQFGRLEVPLAETDTIQVPASAVVQRGQMEMVFVVKDSKAHLRFVKTGKRSDDKVELLSGVSPGEQIVIEGADQLVDGQPVEVK